MNRRTFTKNTIGALFGVSVIPAVGSKPKPFIPSVMDGKAFLNREYLSTNAQVWWPLLEQVKFIPDYPDTP